MLPRVPLLQVRSTLGSQGKNRLDFTRYGQAFSGRPHLKPAEMIEQLPELRAFCRPEPADDFTDRPIGPALWLPLARRIERMLLEEPDVAGVVLVHGTNVLEETAYFLNLAVRSHKPVVLVGAQRPWSAMSTDAHLNLYNAFRVAADPDAAGRGALVLLNDTIHAARDVTKTNTYRVQTFQSPDAGPLGYADPDGVVWHRRPERKHTLQSPFDVARIESFPRVDILYGYAGDDGSLVRAAVGLGARGIVIAGTGAGALGEAKEALQEAFAHGVAIVRSARVGSGRVLADDHYTEPGFIAAGDLNPAKARVLLLLALTQTRDPVRIQRWFDEL